MSKSIDLSSILIEIMFRKLKVIFLENIIHQPSMYVVCKVAAVTTVQYEIWYTDRYGIKHTAVESIV